MPTKTASERDTHVWARVGAGRFRRMLRSEAEERGLEIDKREPLGFGAGFGVRREFITQAERREFFLKTGVSVDDRAGMRRYFKDNPHRREAEKGEDCYDQFDALKECAEGKTLDDKFKRIDLYGDVARGEEAAKKWKDPGYVRERFLQHCRASGVDPNGSDK